MEAAPVSVSYTNCTLPPNRSPQAYQSTTEAPSPWTAPVVPVGPIMRILPTSAAAPEASPGAGAPRPADPPRGSPPVRCEICRSAFYSRSAFEGHPCAAKPSSHKCSLCSKTFTRRYNLKIHVQKHYGNFPHRCVLCGSGFTKKSALSKHILKHGAKRSGSNKSRPQCDICSKVFTRKYTARVHRAKHMENGLWRCPVCPSLFVNMSILKLHLREHADGETPRLPDKGGPGEGGPRRADEPSYYPLAKEVGHQTHSKLAATTDQAVSTAAVPPPRRTEGSGSDPEIVASIDSDFESDGHKSDADDAPKLISDVEGQTNVMPKHGHGTESSLEEGNALSHRGDIKREVDEVHDAGQTIFLKGSIEEGEGPYNWQQQRDHASSKQLSNERFTRRKYGDVGTFSSPGQEVRNVDCVTPFGPITDPLKAAQNILLSNTGSHAKFQSSPHSSRTSEAIALSPAAGNNQSPQTPTPSFRMVYPPPPAGSQASMLVLPLPSVGGVQSSASSSQSSEDTGSTWRCIHCGVSFEDSLMYVVHMGCHGQGNPFACSMCGHVSPGRLAFMLHFVQGQH